MLGCWQRQLQLCNSSTSSSSTSSSSSASNPNPSLQTCHSGTDLFSTLAFRAAAREFQGHLPQQVAGKSNGCDRAGRRRQVPVRADNEEVDEESQEEEEEEEEEAAEG